MPSKLNGSSHFKFAAILFLLSTSQMGCAVVEKMFGRKDPPPAAIPSAAIRPPSGGESADAENPSTNFQWALQSFEAGQYEDALERFSDIAQDGAQNENFDLAVYYQGRSLYLLNRYHESTERLRSYIDHNPRGAHAQDARLTLLLAYNILRDWKNSTVVAAEAIQGESYIGNKILIRLLWAEALIEIGELTGAHKALRETKEMFQGIPEGSLMGDVLTESKSTLSERGLWLESHLQLRSCEMLKPPAKSNAKNKNRLLTEWYSKRGLCLKQAFDIALTAYTVLGPRWNRAMSDSLATGVEVFFDSPRIAANAAAASNLNAAKELALPEIRKYFYQILNGLQAAEASASIPGTVSRPYRSLVSKIEQGLQRLSIQASSANHTQ